MAPLRIEVSGESTIYRPAERAVMSISISSEGKSQDEVSKEVTAVSSQVRDMLKSLAWKDDKGHAASTAPITHWSNSSLSTWSYLKYGTSSVSSKSFRVHNARMTFEAKFRDFAKLGSVATTLSTMKLVNISDIAWRLTEVTKQSITTQCRHQAVRDALSKAKDFAAALDRPCPPVVQVKDSGYGASESVQTYRAMRVSAPGGGGQQEDLSFAPEDVSLQSSVLLICEEI